jgi:hypothetical protein
VKGLFRRLGSNDARNPVRQGASWKRLDQDIHVTLVITNPINIDHPRSPAGMD